MTPNSLGVPTSLDSIFNDPAMVGFVQKLYDAGAQASQQDLTRQANAATTRAQNDANTIQGFYQAGAKMAADISPYYQSILDKGAATDALLGGAYGGAVNRFAPGNGGATTIDATNAAQALNNLRAAVPLGKGKAGDQWSVYGPTTSDIGADNASVRLSQGETERQGFEQQLADLKAQRPGGMLQTLMSLAPLAQQQSATAEAKREWTWENMGYDPRTGKKNPMYNASLAMAQLQAPLALSQVTGQFKGKPTFEAMATQANLTGFYGKIPTLEMQKFKSLDAYQQQMFHLQQKGQIDDNTYKQMSLALQKQAMLLLNTRELSSQGLQQQAITETIAWHHTQAGLQQQIADMNGSSMNYKIAQDNAKQASARTGKAYDVQQGPNGMWKATPVLDSNGKPIPAAAYYPGMGGKGPKPKTDSPAQARKAMSSMKADITTWAHGVSKVASNPDPNDPHKVIHQREVTTEPLSYTDAITQLSTGYQSQYLPAGLALLNKAYPRGNSNIQKGGTGRPWMSADEIQLVDKGGAKAKALLRSIVAETHKRWVTDGAGYTYKILSPQGMKLIATSNSFAFVSQFPTRGAGKTDVSVGGPTAGNDVPKGPYTGGAHPVGAR